MDPKKPKIRKHLCMPGLLNRARYSFDKIKNNIVRKINIPLSDCLMSGLAMFSLKYPSLLQFDKDRNEVERVKHNLKTLFKIEHAPSDTYMRERLDEVDPRHLQKTLDRLIAQLQRGKVLEQYRYFGDYCLVSLDATGCFSSHEIHCESCCVKNHKDGSVTYYHQMLAAVMMHPKYPTVFPLMLEPIQKQDGKTKNDCEHNAAKRLLKNLRNSHPHLKMIIVLDGLYADGVIIKLLKELNFPFIITAQSDDLKYMFEFYRASNKKEITETGDHQKTIYRYANQLPLNDTHHDIEVNVLECIETTQLKKKKTVDEKYFCWITDLPLEEKSVKQIAKGGRARWKIENETFNTLKNQGYQFEHNFGHGNKNLSTVFAYLMFIAFLIDQIQQYCCKYFKAALKKLGTRIRLWGRLKMYFLLCRIAQWDELYTLASGDFGIDASVLIGMNTS